MYLCSVLVIEAQRYNVGGRGVDSRWGPGRTMTLESTQPVTEMCTRNVSWGVKRCRYVGKILLPPSYVVNVISLRK